MNGLFHRESQLANLRLEPLQFYYGHPKDVASFLRTIRRNNTDCIVAYKIGFLSFCGTDSPLIIGINL